jgi:hypothetical protein
MPSSFLNSTKKHFRRLARVVTMTVIPWFTFFYRQYLQQVEVEKLFFPPKDVLLLPVIQDCIYRNFFTHHFMFPSEGPLHLPPPSYQRRVLKELIRRLEGAVSDPNEDVSFLATFILYALDIMYLPTGRHTAKLDRGNTPPFL